MSSPSNEPPPPRHGFWRKHGLKLALSVVIAAAFTWTLQRGGLPLIPPKKAFEQVNVASCVEYMFIFAAWNTIRATRWRHLLAPIADIPLRRILAVSWIGYAAILLMPLRAG